VCGNPRERAPVDGDDDVARSQPGALGGGGIEHARDRQPAAARADADADAGEARRSVEALEFARGEVVREAVVEARDSACDRGAGEASLRYRAIVVVGDAVDRLVDNPGVV